MRLPNGYGCIYKMKNPYRALITTGWELKNDKVIQKRKTLG